MVKTLVRNIQQSFKIISTDFIFNMNLTNLFSSQKRKADGMPYNWESGIVDGYILTRRHLEFFMKTLIEIGLVVESKHIGCFLDIGLSGF